MGDELDSSKKSIALKLSASSHKEAMSHKASRSRKQREHSRDSPDSGEYRDRDYGRSRMRSRGSRSRSRSYSPSRSRGYRSRTGRDPRDKSKVEVWTNKVCILGEKANQLIHFCDSCDKPIRLYGRLIPCKHVFCKACAAQNHCQKCGKCSEPVMRIEQVTQGSIFMCYHGGSSYSKNGCRRTYLSQRDLQAHVEHRHAVKKSATAAVPPGTPPPQPQQVAAPQMQQMVPQQMTMPMSVMMQTPTFAPPPFQPPRMPSIPSSLHNFSAPPPNMYQNPTPGNMNVPPPGILSNAPPPPMPPRLAANLGGPGQFMQNRGPPPQFAQWQQQQHYRTS